MGGPGILGDNIMIRSRQRLRRDWASLQLKRLLDPNVQELTRRGSDRGGWTLPASMVKPGKTAVCVGVGEDITFDVDLNRNGLNVFTLDPTPRSRQHVADVVAAAGTGEDMPVDRSRTNFYDLSGFQNDRLTYLDVGLWSQNTEMRFYTPKDQSHVSHSIVNLQKTAEWFEAKCVTLQSVCDSCQIDRIDILKLDVEGAEYEILKNIVDHGPRPDVLCFEFDELRSPLDGGYLSRILATVRMLKKAGYRFQHIEASNTLFVRNDSPGNLPPVI